MDDRPAISQHCRRHAVLGSTNAMAQRQV